MIPALQPAARAAADLVPRPSVLCADLRRRRPAHPLRAPGARQARPPRHLLPLRSLAPRPRAYWWELLEHELASEGTAVVAARHGLPPDLTAARIGQSLAGGAGDGRPGAVGKLPPRTADELSSQVEAGMEIGFHTIDHDVLPDLEESLLVSAVSVGRDELAAATGASIERFAYRHERSDERAAAALRGAGYRSAWTTTKRTARPADAPMLRGRWDVGHRSLPEMQKILVRGLARPTL